MYLPSTSNILSRRQCFEGESCNSSWDNWARYVVLVGAIVVGLIIFFSFACITARRRRARGNQPYYGTGWMAGQHGAVNYYNNPQAPTQQPYYGTQQQYAQAAPPYSPPANPPYYGNRAEDTNNFEMQPPESAYQPQTGGQPVYSPPAGAPPAKGGDIIR